MVPEKASHEQNPVKQTKITRLSAYSVIF